MNSENQSIAFATITWNDEDDSEWATVFGLNYPEDEWDDEFDDDIFFYMCSDDFKEGFNSGDFTIKYIPRGHAISEFVIGKRIK